MRWLLTARPTQITPDEANKNWRIWLILAGRGWGKTRTGAEDLAHYAMQNAGVRLGIIAPTMADARDTCVEGESGLLSVVPKACLEAWHRSMGEMRLWNGSQIKLFSADEPERLRGPQHHRVWCDEVGAWPSRAAFDQMGFGLRLGADPRAVITTTPRNREILRELLARVGQDVILTHGRTMENTDHLAASVLAQLQARYAGSRLGRQELDAEMLTDTVGALWSREAIDNNRVMDAAALVRVVVAIDPAMSHGEASDETGLVAAGRGIDGHYYVLADWSGRYSPDAWARRAVQMLEMWNAETLVAEVNAGGEMVERVVHSVAASVPFKAVRARFGKAERAMPIAALYEQGRVHHVGSLPRLEDQMTSFTAALAGGKSPDRMDALVWALTELSDAPRGQPRVWVL